MESHSDIIYLKNDIQYKMKSPFSMIIISSQGRRHSYSWEAPLPFIISTVYDSSDSTTTDTIIINTLTVHDVLTHTSSLVWVWAVWRETGEEVCNANDVFVNNSTFCIPLLPPL